jgi:ribosomal protein S2
VKKVVSKKRITNNKSSKICVKTSFLLVALQRYQIITNGLHYGTSYKIVNNLNLQAVNLVFYDFYKNLSIITFSPNHTLFSLKSGLVFLTLVISKRGKAMFADVISVNYFGNIFKQSGQSYICGKWPTGFLTNFKTLYRFFLKNDYINATTIRNIGGLRRLPNVMILPSLFRNFWSYRETCRMRLSALGLNDGGLTSHGILYSIPANSSSMHSLILFAHLVSSSILSGYEKEVRFFFVLLRKRKIREIFLKKLLFERLYNAITKEDMIIKKKVKQKVRKNQLLKERIKKDKVIRKKVKSKTGKKKRKKNEKIEKKKKKYIKT